MMENLTDELNPINASVENTSTASSLTLHAVLKVTATLEENVYVLDVDITDATGTRSIMFYVSRPDDPFGLNPAIRQWLVDNEGTYEIHPYVPPPPAVYVLSVSAMWDRMTDQEGEDFDAAMSVATPLKSRKAFNAAVTLRSDSDLFAWVRNVLLTVTTEERANVIMAQ